VFEIGDVGSRMRAPCPHQGAGGCEVYAARPGGCREYLCDWRGGLHDDALRPDRLGLILDTVLTTAPDGEDLAFVRAMEARPDALLREPAAQAAVFELSRTRVVQVVPWNPGQDAFRGPVEEVAEIQRRLAQADATPE
jgi:hypothetical protein